MKKQFWIDFECYCINAETEEEAGKQWGWGGSLACKDADGFSVYMKNIVPWSEREEVVQSREISSKYNKLLNKYNNLIMKQIVAKLIEDVDGYDLCSDDWRNVRRSLDSLMANVENGYKELESY